jgi:hypothetical protein
LNVRLRNVAALPMDWPALLMVTVRVPAGCGGVATVGSDTGLILVRK